MIIKRYLIALFTIHSILPTLTPHTAAPDTSSNPVDSKSTAGIIAKFGTFQCPGIESRFTRNLVFTAGYLAILAVISRSPIAKYRWCADGLQILMQLPVFYGIYSYQDDSVNRECDPFHVPRNIMTSCGISAQTQSNLITKLRLFILMFGGLSLLINAINLFAPYRTKIIEHEGLSKIINAIAPPIISPSAQTLSSQFFDLISTISPITRFFTGLFLECAPLAQHQFISGMLAVFRALKGYTQLGYRL